MKTPRAILKRVTDAAHAFSDQMFYNGDDRDSPEVERAGERLDRALEEADKYLTATAPKRVAAPKEKR